MEGKKKGGYEAKLTPRARRDRNDTIAYEKGWSRGQKEKRPEEAAFAEHLLSSFHTEQLKEIFSDYLQKSGVSQKEANMSAFDGVLARPFSNKEIAAAYNAYTNQTTLSTSNENFVEAMGAYSRGEQLPEALLMQMQLVFIHETVHAMSRVRLSFKDFNNQQTFLTQEGGYTHSQAIISKSMRPEKTGGFKVIARSFEALNEGVTQRIAEEIFVEYARRVGQSDTVAKYIASSEHGQQLWLYSVYMNQVDAICERIAEYVALPKEVVWGAFKRGYFEDPELFNEETLALFEETFGEDFLSEYQKLDNSTPIGTLGRFDGSHGFPSPDGYAKKWLEHLGISPK